MPSAFPGGTLTEATNTTSPHKPQATSTLSSSSSPMATTAAASAAAAASSPGAPGVAPAAAAGASPSKQYLQPVVEDCNVTVAVRVRPMTAQEKAQTAAAQSAPYLIVDDAGRQLSVHKESEGKTATYAFDHCFGAATSQAEVFDAVGRKVLTHAWEGFNASVFAYGQTGSGKTHTMMGGPGAGPEDAGLLPRICRQLFQAIEEAKERNARSNVRTRVSYGPRLGDDEEAAAAVAAEETAPAAAGSGGDSVEFGLKVQYLEIYNEKIYDLLADGPAGSTAGGDNLRLREDPSKKMFVEGAKWQEVGSWEELQAVLKRGEENRTVAATKANVESSRSHAIFFLEFRQVSSKRSLLPKSTLSGSLGGNVAVERVSTICLVDLAGSERLVHTGATGARLEESKNINLSLMTLGKVISGLAKQADSGKENCTGGGSPAKKTAGAAAGGSGFINYRESKLTHLLRDFLGGNAKTVMLATIAPALGHHEQTMGTLRYANEAKNIVTHPMVNEDPKDREIRQLREALEATTAELEAMRLSASPSKASAFQEIPVHHTHAQQQQQPKKASPVLKVDGKEAGDSAAPHQRRAAAPLSPAGSATGFSSVATASSVSSASRADDDGPASHMEDELGVSTSTAATTPSIHNAGHRRVHSKSSEKGMDGSSTGAGASGSRHGRTPSEVSRLPRLAASKPLAASGAAPGLPAPISAPIVSPPNLAGATDKPAAAATASPFAGSASVVSAALAAEATTANATVKTTTTMTTTTTAAAGGAQQPNIQGSFYSGERMTVADAQEMKARFLAAAEAATAQADRELAREALVAALTTQALTALPLVIEANSLAQAANKPVAFYLDVLPRKPAAEGAAARVAETLQHLGHAPLVEAMGLASSAGPRGGEDTTGLLLPAQLEAAEEAPAVVVRAVGALNDALCELSVEEFREALQAMRLHRARPDGPMPLLQASLQQPCDIDSPPPLADYAPGAGGAGDGVDAFRFEGQDSLLGRGEVYLAALLENRNVLGSFPLLDGVDGACVGSVKLRLVPQGELPDSPVGVEGGYSLMLELEDLTVDKARLGQLGLGGAWNVGPDGTHVGGALRYPDEGAPSLVLRYGFWPQEACGQVELSPHSAAVREMAGGASGGSARKQQQQQQQQEAAATVSFPMGHKTTLHVPAVTPAFLTYLATGALRVSLHLSKDPAEAEMWARHQGLPQPPTERALALSRVRCTDPTPFHAEDGETVVSVPQAVGGGGVRPGHRRRPAMRLAADIPEDQEVDDAGDLFSVMGSIAPAGAFETCSRLSMRMAGAGRLSVRRSSATCHAAHFYGAKHPNTACFLFMAVDVLEPVLEPGVDYFNEAPTKFVPVDIKPISSSWLRRRAGPRGAVPPPPSASSHHHHHGADFDDDNGSVVSEMDGWGAASDMDSVASGFGMGGGHGHGLGLGHQAQPLQRPLDPASGANAVFHVTANPLIRARRLRLVLEQVGPLAGPMLLESCLRVRASSFVSMHVREYTGDISEHTMCATDLPILRVARSDCKRRLEVVVEMPSSGVLLEKCPRGERVVLALEVAAFVEGAAQPVVVQRNVVMKVLAPERKQSMLYQLKKSLREPLSDRLHRVGTYYAVKTAQGPHLRDTVQDFVRYKLAAQSRLLHRLARARALQDGPDDRRPDLPTFQAWKQALDAPQDAAAGKGGKAKMAGELEVDTDDAAAAASPRPPAFSVMLMNLPERKAVAAALFGLDLQVHQPHGHGKRSGSGMARGAVDGVYRAVDGGIPSSEHAAAAVAAARAGATVEFAYPPRGMGEHAEVERLRGWDALSRVWTEEVPDFPVTREGFLNLRTGLLGVQSTRMWFVWRRPFLFVYKAKPDGSGGYQAPAEVINVTDCAVSLGKDDLDFEIKAPTKTWALQACGEEDLTAWILALGQPVPGVTDERGNLLLLGNGGGAGAASVVGGMPLLCYGGGPASSAGSVASHSYHQRVPSLVSYRGGF